ncbi:MAG: hypothetical protein PUB37_00040 [Firmicutes bacterium]|nr:hypothetical protein [Bacillota bacterium]
MKLTSKTQKSAKSENQRKIADLLRLKGRVYVRLANEEIGRRFLRDAEREGFTFGDGAKPTEREYSDIFAVNRDMTINYVGFVGHIAFSGAKKTGGERLFRVDYEKYSENEKDYMVK